MKKYLSKYFTYSAIIAIIVILMAGLFYYGVPQMTALGQDKYIQAPEFGYIKCEEATGGSKSIERTFGADTQIVTCAKDNQGELLGMNDGCVITFITPKITSLVPRNYVYQVNNEPIQNIEGGMGGYSGETININLNRGDILKVGYTKSISLLFKDGISEGQKYKVSGNSYTLFNYDTLSATNGQQLQNTRVGSCLLENNYYTNRQITYEEGIDVLKGKELDFKNLNQPNGVYTYFSHWTPVPNFASQIETLNDMKVYCMNRALYKVLPITTPEGSYNIVNYEKSGFIKTVTCCNGEDTPDKTCINHEFVAKTNVQCDINKGILCPQSQYQPFGDAQYKRFVCQQNKCVEDIIKVKCNKNSDCGQGEVCSTGFDVQDNQCVKGGAGQITIPIIPTKDNTLLYVIIGGFVLLIAVILMTDKKKKRKVKQMVQ